MQLSQKTLFALLALVLMLLMNSVTSSSPDDTSDVQKQDLDTEFGDSEVDASESYERLARLLPWIDNQAEELSVVRSKVVVPPPPQYASQGRYPGKPDHPDLNKGRPVRPIIIKDDQHQQPVKPGQKLAKPPPRLPPKPADAPRLSPMPVDAQRPPAKPVDQSRPEHNGNGPQKQNFRPPIGSPEVIRSSSPAHPESGLDQQLDQLKAPTAPFPPQDNQPGY